MMPGAPRWTAAITTFALTALTSCATNPVTGRAELSLISQADEIRMGRQSVAASLQEHAPLDHPEMQAMVRRIGAQMAARSERPNLPWEFGVLDDASVNAFAAPGGFVYVSRGLLTHLTNEAELATVLGHEVGHVTARHSAREASKVQAMEFVIAGASETWKSVKAHAALLERSAQLLRLKFNRDDELQSDQLGFRYALSQGYDVRQASNVYRTLGRVEEERGGERVPGWQNTHPDPGNRELIAKQRAAALAPGALANTRVNRDGYLRMLDGMIFGENPRLGFFEGVRFYHPELKFQFDLPAEWRGQNMSDRVIAVSADNQAQLQLTFGAGAPMEAVQQFTSEAGIKIRSTRSGTINGLPAALTVFEAQAGTTDALVGEVGAVQYAGQTYLIFGFAAAQAEAQLAKIEQTILSFRALTDARILAMRPDVVQLVTLPVAMTGLAFVQRYPSVVSASSVYTINEMEPTTILAKGALIKRVVREQAR